ncbi:hypothetical protein DFQ28_009891 [Apophysomyces sp. BC1034]|nr:hypothetical protein DFQ30_009449 [Apophysomyces sp. BC1015]KAG0181579.1 hypothetical protein DFQ29_007839 [Apophysomyces sp. BC1021]KAG0192218.1 hypothetical protein DFQ28_009891 [Apophysomyces sp. BC1034]
MSERVTHPDTASEKYEYGLHTPPEGEKTNHELSYDHEITEFKGDKASDTEEEDVYVQIANELASTEDDTTLKCLTVRALVTGIVLAAVSSSVAQLMQFKPVGVPLSNTFMMILSYLICNLWYRSLPKGGWLNPGPFNTKEHVCIYVLVSSANVSAYGTYILGAQQLYYPNSSPTPAGGIFLLFATQIVGYGIAGQLRPFLVYPSHVIWPQALPTVSLLKTLNTNNEDSKWRTKFFFMVFGGIFVYEFIPQYMFPLLGGISIFCLAKRDSVLFQNLFGGLNLNEGMGILNLSFDWNYLNAVSPLVLPLYVQFNYFFGILVVWIMAPLLYYHNVWDAQKFPFLSNSLFAINATTGEGEKYPQDKVLNADNSLNETKYAEVGPAYYSILAGVQYILLNMGVTATITHVALYYGKDIWKSFRDQWRRTTKSNPENMDIHMRLMAAYKEVPIWWYYILFVLGIALNIGLAYANHSDLPWWGVIFAIAMSTILSLPLNFIGALTGINFGLNVVAEMICGFVLKGFPVANMYFKTLGFNTMNQAGIMAQDLKIGHYLKVPPRMIFLNQLLGTVVGCIFNYIINHLIVENKREVLLSLSGDRFWSGAGLQTINAAAITWGAIGPMAMFGPGTMYHMVLWGFIIGFFIPVPAWLLHKRFPKWGFDKINTTVILNAFFIVPGSNTSYLTVGFIIMLVSQFYVKRYYRSWFIKHNYLISAALDSGTSILVFILAMAVQGGANGETYLFPTWAGNLPADKNPDYCCYDCPDS